MQQTPIEKKTACSVHVGGRAAVLEYQALVPHRVYNGVSSTSCVPLHAFLVFCARPHSAQAAVLTRQLLRRHERL